MKNYVVYFAFLGGELVYIGKGFKGREFHLTTGTSHVYEANKAHFEGKTLEVKSISLSKQEESDLEIEKTLIQAFNPPWNKQHSSEGKYFQYKSVSQKEDVNTLLVEEIRSLIEYNKSIEIQLISEIDCRKLYESKFENVNKSVHDLEVMKRGIGSMSKKEYMEVLRCSGYTQVECMDILGISLSTAKRWDKKIKLKNPLN